MSDTSLILASASPQRKRLLEGLGIEFSVVPSQVNEEECTIDDPSERAMKLAFLKAEDVSNRYPDKFVIGCDTLVVSSNGTLLEKPKDEDDARRMLRLQSGNVSEVHSGLTVMAPAGSECSHSSGISSSDVHFKNLSDEDIEWWIGTGLWKDRSGSFQIDGLGQLMIEWIRGDWTGIVGLPVFLLGNMLKEVKYPFKP
jgi:septum formation protein